MSKSEPRQANPPFLIRLIRAALGLFAAATIQGAISLTIGGALLGMGILLGVPVSYAPLLLLAGMALPLWPLRIYFSPERILERKFVRWDQWVERGMITKRQCNQWKDGLRSWYVQQVPGLARQQEHGADVSRPGSSTPREAEA